MTIPRQLAIVANRGPNDFVWQDGSWITRRAAGGLVSMLEPLARQPDVVWFCCVAEPSSAEHARDGLITTAADAVDPELQIVPIPLPAPLYSAYYGQISNEVLWMLQHHLVGQYGFDSLDARRHQAWDEGYLAANRRVAEAILASDIPIGAFMIQDYHLYPLPALLRQVYPTTPILHFTHIPFPDPPTLKLLPAHWRRTILEGLLGADIVGLQTRWDVWPFLLSCEEILGCPVDYRQATVIASDGRTVRVRAIPASTDPAALRTLMQTPAVAAARQRLAAFAGYQTIIRVDRLDPSKNQIIGFLAFARLLEQLPERRPHLRFLAFLVPSRTDLSVYRAYRDAVYAVIDQINQRFAADCGGPPIEVFYTNDREQALAAMEIADLLLVNSLEDGMNLVAKEWAIVSGRPGVLVVSETAGVAADMGDDVLLISPRDVEGTAAAMATGLAMPIGERRRRLARLRSGVDAWTAADWLAAQVDALNLTLPDGSVGLRR